MKNLELLGKPVATTETNSSSESAQENTQENVGTKFVSWVILKLAAEESRRKLQPIFQESPELGLVPTYSIHTTGSSRQIANFPTLAYASKAESI